MSFNPDPTKQATEILFSLKKNCQNHPPVYFNGTLVKRVEHHKHLGLTLDSKLSFNNHVNNIISKVRKSIGIIRYLAGYLPIKTLDQIYKLQCRPHLDYCDVIFHSPAIPSLFDSSINLTNLMQRLESTQYQAALAITRAWKGTSQNKLYEELGCEYLSDRRWARRLFQFFKIFHNISPDYLKVNLPPLRRHLYGVHQPNILKEIFSRTTKYKNSFFPNSVKIWNCIGPDIRGIDSLSAFKKTIVPLIRPPGKPIFNIYDPVGGKYLFWLRVGLSPLKSHKHCHNFGDTFSNICTNCNVPEDTHHFLFKCSLFTLSRNNMLQTTNIILGKYGLLHLCENVCIYLYGDRKISVLDNNNNKILLATINFIKDTERFTPI